MKFGIEHFLLTLSFGYAAPNIEPGFFARSSEVWPLPTHRATALSQRGNAAYQTTLDAQHATERTGGRRHWPPPLIADTVQHNKDKGGGYLHGSPLYDKQQAFEATGYPEVTVRNRICMWMCALLFLSCCSMIIGGSTSQYGGRHSQVGTKGIKLGVILGLVSVVVTIFVVAYVTFGTSIMSDFMAGKSVGMWCTVLCVWALIQVCSVVLMLLVLTCFMMLAGASVMSHAEPREEQQHKFLSAH